LSTGKIPVPILPPWQRREHPAARELLEGLLARSPQLLEARRLLAYVLLDEDRDPDAAEACLRAVLAQAQGDAEGRHNLRLLQRRHVPALSS
jgi:hypothetical protein